MYLYEGSETISINTTDVYHALTGLLEGDIDTAFTFISSTTGSVTNTANSGGKLRCTSAAHGLTTGQTVTLNGMGDAAHNGVTVITKIDDNTFDCTDVAYNSASDTGSWQRGSGLQVNTGFGGAYSFSYSISASVAVSNKNVVVEPYVNSTAIDEAATERLFGNTGYGVAGSGGEVMLIAGDIVWLGCRNTTDTQDLIIRHTNIHLDR